MAIVAAQRCASASARSTTSAYLASTSARLFSCSAGVRSAQASRTTCGRNPEFSASIAVARTHPDVETPASTTVSTPAPGEPIVVKQYASAFFGTTLAATLHTAGVDTVVVAGVSTSGCVRASAMDALNSGFRPQVVRQACADRTEALHEANLADLDAKYADVVDLPEALAHF
jgi:nicotinamidase-related amidase